MQIWKIACEEANRLSSVLDGTSLERDDLVGYGWERILTELSDGASNSEDKLRRWARFGMIEALRRETNRPQPIGLI